MIALLLIVSGLEIYRNFRYSKNPFYFMYSLDSMDKKLTLLKKDYEEFNFCATISKKNRNSYSLFVSENHNSVLYCYHILFRDLRSGLKVLHEDAAKRTGENRKNKSVYYENNKKRPLKMVLENALCELQSYRNFQNIIPYIYFLKSSLNEFEVFGFSLGWEI